MDDSVPFCTTFLDEPFLVFPFTAEFEALATAFRCFARDTSPDILRQ